METFFILVDFFFMFLGYFIIIFVIGYFYLVNMRKDYLSHKSQGKTLKEWLELKFL